MRQTRQRMEIVGALEQSAGFISVQSLYAELRARGRGVGLTTIYRTLQELDREHQLDMVHHSSGERLFQPRPSEDHRHHLVCRDCGTSQPLDTSMIESWITGLSAATGFTEIHHTLELDGICADCRLG